MTFGKVFDVAKAVEIALFLIASERDGAGGVDPKNCGQRNVGHVLFSLPRMEPKAMTGHRLLPSGEQRSEEHTSELQSLMRISYAVFCLKKKNQNRTTLRSQTQVTVIE